MQQMSIIFEKIKTVNEIWKRTVSIDEKINLLKCIYYNIKPNFIKKTDLNFLPISTTIYVNTICNYRCSFCFLINEDHIGSKKMNLDVDGFIKIINSDFLKYSTRITLGGGEPYLNKNIFNFFKILKEKNKIVSIYTNGSLIERNYENFIKYQPDYLNISHYDDKFEDLKKIFKKINTVGEKKFISRLSKIAQSDQLEKMEQTIYDAIDNNFDRIIFQNYFPYKDKEKNLVLYKDNLKYYEIKNKLEKKYKNKIKIVWPNLLARNSVFNCNNIAINATVDSNGDTAPCCFLTPPTKKNGNIFEKVENPWNSKNMKNFRSFFGKTDSPSACENCYFKQGINNRAF